ncbi:hypothetical protein F511_19401 [Dorcoceras hygrometricum]|uniref:Uncharacterized protein n=1 Tax=Dorcoceras hygrometricum TaxID=472368 RepID=A0A2Z7D1G1_9LAMI|nr:hypothetical protein F511_19401 [Dorcoceras hygrometricum]
MRSGPSHRAAGPAPRRSGFTVACWFSTSKLFKMHLVSEQVDKTHVDGQDEGRVCDFEEYHDPRDVASQPLTRYQRTVRMKQPRLPSDNIVRSAAESVDSVPISPENREQTLPDQTELGSSGLPWYEEKASNLRLADILAINRLTRAWREVTSSRQSLDEVLEHHTELAKLLEELEAIRAEEKRSFKARMEALEAVKTALEAEKGVLEAAKKAMEAELADTRARDDRRAATTSGAREIGRRVYWLVRNDQCLRNTYSHRCFEGTDYSSPTSRRLDLLNFRGDGNSFAEKIRLDRYN